MLKNLGKWWEKTGFSGLGRLFVGMISPLDSLHGLAKGTLNFLKNPSQYFYSTYRNPDRIKSKRFDDSQGRAFSSSYSLSRIATVAVGVLCVLGFIGALAVPFPGVAPLYGLTVAGIAKAAGITIGWCSGAKFASGVAGILIDRKVNNSWMQNIPIPGKKPIIGKLGALWFAMKLAIFGEQGPRLLSKKKSSVQLKPEESHSSISGAYKSSHGDVMRTLKGKKPSNNGFGGYKIPEMDLDDEPSVVENDDQPVGSLGADQGLVSPEPASVTRLPTAYPDQITPRDSASFRVGKHSQ